MLLRRSAMEIVLKGLLTITVIGTVMPSSSLGYPPALVRHQTTEVQRAWAEIEQLLQENEKLTPPLAEPYLSRGDLWSRIGGHEDALADYLRATELFFQGNPTPGEQARHLARLRTSLEAIVNQPRPHYPGDAATEFDRGLSAFRAGRDDAAHQCFVDCTRLMPNEPLYRVYRGISHQKLGQTDSAKKQVAIAVSLIRMTGAEAANRLAMLHRSLEPVQGPLRIWLNSELYAVGPNEESKRSRPPR